MFRPKDLQERIAHRLKITQGHLKKVTLMVEENSYCIDVIHQSQAIQKALREIDNLILENHLKTCSIEAIREGKEDEALDEVVSIFKKRSL
ncbi:metal-sensitive transcriptional regulator [soil metagenome]